MPRVASRQPQDCFNSRWLTSANLGPTCAQVGSNLSQVGPMLGSSWLQLRSSRDHVGLICGVPAAPGPTQALPDPFLVASWPPRPLQDSKWIPKGPPKPPTWTLNPQLGAQNTVKWIRKSCLPGPQIPPKPPSLQASKAPRFQESKPPSANCLGGNRKAKTILKLRGNRQVRTP